MTMEIASYENLVRAFEQVERNDGAPGPDRQKRSANAAISGAGTIFAPVPVDTGLPRALTQAPHGRATARHLDDP